MFKYTVLYGVSEEHQILLHDTRCVVVLVQGVRHVFLQLSNVMYVFIHIIWMNIVSEYRRLLIGTNVVKRLIKK